MINRSSGMVHMVTPTNEDYEQGSKELPEEEDESYLPAAVRTNKSKYMSRNNRLYSKRNSDIPRHNIR